jgi:hypothetical protein
MNFYEDIMKKIIIGLLAASTILSAGVANARGYYHHGGGSNFGRAALYTAVAVGAAVVVTNAYSQPSYSYRDNYYDRQRYEDSIRAQENYDRVMRERAAYQNGFQNGYDNGYNNNYYPPVNSSNVYFVPQRTNVIYVPQQTQRIYEVPVYRATSYQW